MLHNQSHKRSSLLSSPLHLGLALALLMSALWILPVPSSVIRAGTRQFDHDFGDAPAPPYPMAGHVIIGEPPETYLGGTVDSDPSYVGQATAFAHGDDYLDNNDDEDGVVFTSKLRPVQGSSTTVDVTVSKFGYLNAWIDFNANGDWDDSGEHIFDDRMVSAGTSPLSFLVPSNVASDLTTTFARFRFSLYPGLSYAGIAEGGEVEDHQVLIASQWWDFGDAPDPPYPTTLIAPSDGARHPVYGQIYLGAGVDAEFGIYPTAAADGDDILSNGDDEDGVTFTSMLQPGITATVDVVASVAGKLNAWIDFNADGDWDDSDEQVFDDQALVAGTNPLNFIVPPGATPTSTTYARFRFDTGGNLSYYGAAINGEVEDYLVQIWSHSIYLPLVMRNKH